MNPTTTRNQIAGEVRAAMARANSRTADIADRAGMSRRSLERKLAGERPFAIEELLAIAEALQVSAATLLPAPAEAAPVPKAVA